MSAWGLDPGFINANWTEELLALMFEKLSERRRAEVEYEASLHGAKLSGGRGGERRMTNEEFFALHGGAILHQVHQRRN